MDAYETSWTLIGHAAEGVPVARGRFVERYTPVIKAYLGARWAKSFLFDSLDDVVQEVFIECFKTGGVLERVERDRGGGFRAFFYGTLRNVARMSEDKAFNIKEQQADTSSFIIEIDDREEWADEAFDRAWRGALVRDALGYQESMAGFLGADAERRVELLRLRFEEDLAIREIAKKWGSDPARVHHEYAKARDEFQKALRHVLSQHHPDAPDEVARELKELQGELPEG